MLTEEHYKVEQWTLAAAEANYKNKPPALPQLGGKTLSSIGLARATLHLNWKAAIYNLRRFVCLKEAGVVAF